MSKKLVELIPPSKNLIGEAVNLVVYIEKTKSSREVKEVRSVTVKDGEYKLG